MASDENTQEDLESFGPEVEDDGFEVDPDDEAWQLEGGEQA